MTAISTALGQGYAFEKFRTGESNIGQEPYPCPKLCWTEGDGTEILLMAFAIGIEGWTTVSMFA